MILNLWFVIYNFFIEETVKILKGIADESRLKILASLLREPMYVELISERLDLHPSTTSFHLKKLEKLGLVTSEKEQYYTMFHLNKSNLNINIMKVVSGISLDSQTEEDLEQAYYMKIRDTFFKDGKLVLLAAKDTAGVVRFKFDNRKK